MPTSGYLSQSLRRPLPTKDDGILRTVADAAGYMMALSTDRQRAHWQRAARLILDGADADDLSRQVALAPSPQPQPAPTARALPPKPVAQEGQNWTPIGGQIWKPIDRNKGSGGDCLA